MKLKLIAIFVFFLLFFSACVYMPQLYDVPLISEKNDVRIDGGVSLFKSGYGTISYGLTDKIAIQAAGTIGDGDYYFGQAAVGYYNVKNKRIFEFYGGYGQGYGYESFTEYNGSLGGKYQVYFIQSNIGYIFNPYIDIAFGLKGGLMQSHLADWNYYYDILTYTDDATIYNDNSFLLEPTISIRFGLEKIKLNLKFGGVVIDNLSSRERYIPYSPINVGLGVNFNF